MNWIVIGAVWGFLGVVCGAFGAHGLKDVASPEQLEWWKTAALYHLLHAPLLVLIGNLVAQQKSTNASGWLIFAGSLVFSGTLYAMALGAPRWFGAITPIGGVLLMLGWGTLAWSARARAN